MKHSYFLIYGFSVINFPFRSVLAVSHRFDMLYFNFHFVHHIFLNSLEASLDYTELYRLYRLYRLPWIIQKGIV